MAEHNGSGGDERRELDRLAGRVGAIEEATKIAAKAGEHAAGASSEAIATVRHCTMLISILLPIILAAFGVFGYLSLEGAQSKAEKRVEGIEDAAQEALDKADESWVRMERRLGDTLAKADASRDRVESRAHQTLDNAWDTAAESSRFADTAKRSRDEAEKSVKDVAKAAVDLQESMAEMQRRAEEDLAELESQVTGAEAATARAEAWAKRAQTLVTSIDNLLQRALADASAAAKRDPTKEISAEERRVAEDTTRRLELLEDLGQELTPEAYFVRGNTYYSRKEYERALAEYDRALAGNPDYADVHSWRGYTLFELGRYEEALAALSRVIELKPFLAPPYYIRACTYSLLNRPDEALRDLRYLIERWEAYLWMALEEKDRHFANLRDHPEFRKLVGLDEGGGEGE
jgi:tetratricopeptide (TPR) repeat protein